MSREEGADREEATTVLVLGLPGSGKSTICRLLADRRNGTWLSASSALQNYAAQHPEVGERWRRHWARGENAPDAEVSAVLWGAYQGARRGIVLLDGYPRTLGQARDFTSRGGKITVCLLLDLPLAAALSRIRARATADERSDDAPELAAPRISREQAALLEILHHPSLTDKCRKVDATAAKDVVARNCLAAISVE